MTAAGAVARLRAVAGRFDEWERPVFSPRSGSQALPGVEVPASLVEFFAACDQITAMSIHNGYTLGGAAWVLRELKNGTFPQQVESQAVLPFGTDGGGNAFLVGIAEDAVWGWNHETGELTRVADSLAAFLNRVADDWEHYADGDNAWRYLV